VAVAVAQPLTVVASVVVAVVAVVSLVGRSIRD
jgi:hypothetical protein